MSPVPHYAKKRDANEPEIISALEGVGATVYQIDRPADLLVGYDGKTFILEIKMPFGRLTTSEQRWWDAPWAGQRAIVRNVIAALEAIGARNNGR